MIFYLRCAAYLRLRPRTRTQIQRAQTHSRRRAMLAAVTKINLPSCLGFCFRICPIYLTAPYATHASCFLTHFVACADLHWHISSRMLSAFFCASLQVYIVFQSALNNPFYHQYNYTFYFMLICTCGEMFQNWYACVARSASCEWLIISLCKYRKRSILSGKAIKQTTEFHEFLREWERPLFQAWERARWKRRETRVVSV